MISGIHLTVTDFEQMIARGDFVDTRGRVELIRGELIQMSPAGPEHSDIVGYLNEWSTQQAKLRGYTSRTENPLRILATESLVEPDFVWVPRRRYGRAHPEAEVAVLVIEVSHSSLRKDRNVMLPLYAEAGIPEYWIVNCHEWCIEVHRQPSESDYQERFVVGRDEKLSPLVAPDAILDVAELFADE